MRFTISAAAALMMAAPVSAATITLDFEEGSFSIVDQTADYTEYLVNGVRVITSGLIEDGVVKNTAGSGGAFFTLSTFPTSGYLDVASFDLRGSGTVEFSDGANGVQLQAAANFQSYGPYNNLTGAFIFSGSQQFDLDNIVIRDAPIPEPASWAMMIAGFGLAGAAARRVRTGQELPREA